MVPPDQLWLPWIVRLAASGPPINIIAMRRFATNTCSTDLGRSVHVLPKRLTVCWLEVTRFLSRDPNSFIVINAYRLTP